MSTGPGKVSGTRAYTGRVISIDVDEVRFPDGSTGRLEMVRHPGASAIVPVLEGGADIATIPADPLVLLMRQYRYAAEGYLYEVPAGKLDAGEAPETCAHRELQEETGYSAERVELLTMMYTTPGFTDEKIWLYMATGLSAGEAHREADEFMEPHPVRLSEAVRMIERGELTDAKSALALLLAQKRLAVR